MIRLAADEDFHDAVVAGLRQRDPDLDLVRVQEAGLSGSPDPMILAWAAREGRVLLTHDAATMPGFAYQRIEQGLAMPGVFVLSQQVSIGTAIEAILFATQASREGEWEGRVEYLSL
ncbi:MAG: DUF5615 family PIN-like protein [Dehalococcoidia bacterium]